MPHNFAGRIKGTPESAAFRRRNLSFSASNSFIRDPSASTLAESSCIRLRYLARNVTSIGPASASGSTSRLLRASSAASGKVGSCVARNISLNSLSKSISLQTITLSMLYVLTSHYTHTIKPENVGDRMHFTYSRYISYEIRRCPNTLHSQKQRTAHPRRSQKSTQSHVRRPQQGKSSTHQRQIGSRTRSLQKKSQEILTYKCNFTT